MCGFSFAIVQIVLAAGLVRKAEREHSGLHQSAGSCDLCFAVDPLFGRPDKMSEPDFDWSLLGQNPQECCVNLGQPVLAKRKTWSSVVSDEATESVRYVAFPLTAACDGDDSSCLDVEEVIKEGASFRETADALSQRFDGELVGLSADLRTSPAVQQLAERGHRLPQQACKATTTCAAAFDVASNRAPRSLTKGARSTQAGLSAGACRCVYQSLGDNGDCVVAPSEGRNCGRECRNRVRGVMGWSAQDMACNTA